MLFILLLFKNPYYLEYTNDMISHTFMQGPFGDEFDVLVSF